MALKNKQSAARRRSGTDYDSIREIMDEYFKPRDWHAMLAAMKKEAQAGNVRAFIALRDTRFGPPYLPMQPSVGGEPLRIEALVAIKPEDD